jgi:hypothetical protein
MWNRGAGYFLRALELSADDDAVTALVADNLRRAQSLARQAHQDLVCFLKRLDRERAPAH